MWMENTFCICRFSNKIISMMKYQETFSLYSILFYHARGKDDVNFKSHRWLIFVEMRKEIVHKASNCSKCCWNWEILTVRHEILSIRTEHLGQIVEVFEPTKYSGNIFLQHRFSPVTETVSKQTWRCRVHFFFFFFFFSMWCIMDFEAFPGVFWNKGTCLFIFRDYGNIIHHF